MTTLRPAVLALVFAIVAADVQGAFRYADDVSTTGGQFNANYPPGNLINNGFTSPADTIDTRVDYISSGNNYATASGTIANYDITFNFNEPMDLSAMHVWNYVWRNGTGGGPSPNNGVDAYTLKFYSGVDGTGSLLNNASGNLAKAVYDALNPAQTIEFGVTNSGVRSVVLHVASSHGGGSFSGMNEVAFESTGSAPGIISFRSSTNVVTYGSAATLSWEVASATNLVIDPDVGSVLSQTTNGVGSIQIAPTNGVVTYTLTADGVTTRAVTLIGLPTKSKLHIYLLIGQSNMQGAGTVLDPVLDAPLPRVLQFGSRDGMESEWVQAQHPLTSLSSGGNAIGMGLEFAKTMLASNADPDVVICLINHALGATAIQWWAPGRLRPKVPRTTSMMRPFSARRPLPLTA